MPTLVPPPALRPMLERLIALSSVSSVSPVFDQPNRAVIAQLAEWCEGAGFAVEVQPLQAPGKANLIARLGPPPQPGTRAGLALTGHTDTVPCNPELWGGDPFRLREQDGQLIGLGICDMKGFLALALEAARGLDSTRLTAPLWLVATADEESSMSGAKALRADQLPAEAVVIGEPTSLKPIRAHKGVMMEAIRVTGRAGHSSDPALGLNAIEVMHAVTGELLALRAEWGRRYRDTAFAVPVPTMNLGHIHGGDNPNRICPACELHIDIRPLPGMALDDLRGELELRLAPVAVRLGAALSIRRLFSGTGALETPAEAPLVRTAEGLTGTQAGTVAFGTEGPYFRALRESAADPGPEVLILGPGDIAVAHQPDESLPLARIPATLNLLAQLIRHYCLREAKPR